MDALTLGRNNKGTLVVFASGNNALNNPLMDYPSTFNDNILTVGAISNNGQRALFPQNNGGSGFGEKLDVVAPGFNILSTIPSNQTGLFNGTSMASPFVAGLCALILSVNPCLTGKQVRDIIEQTAQKVGIYSYSISPNRLNGDWNSEMGYGLIDAFAAVQLAMTLGSPDLDLYIKDSHNDVGFEPNTATQFMWNSDDIWVRNNNNNTLGVLHQNPEYHSNNQPNFVKVRIKNKSCLSSTGNEKIKLYWAKASTSLAWPNNWNGSMLINNIPLGGEIGELNIPPLESGAETIVSFDWIVPNPADYTTINSEPWHFCLLARIVSDQDLMAFPETWDVNANTKNNNNIAWKNVTVVDVLADNNYNPIKIIGGVIAIGNPFDEQRVFFLEMVKEDIETGKAIYEEAEISIKMDEILYQAWERGGKESQLLDETLDERKLVVKGNNVILDNISFEAKEQGSAYISFNFLIRELTDKSNYRYHVIQRDAVSGDIIGGEHLL
jgi:hypothetical protein